MIPLDQLFNGNKVHLKLCGMLPEGEVHVAHIDRFSLAEADGIVTQVLNTTSRFPDDPDVCAYLRIDPADAQVWDHAYPMRLTAAVREAASRSDSESFGAIWVKGRDVHPHCRHNDVVAAIVLLGSTLFVRATTSAVKRSVHRSDGPDENAYTVLMTQLVRHYSPTLLRFDEDTTRAARDDLSSGILADTCIGRGTKVQFGSGQKWDAQDPMQQQMLKQQLGYGSMDDVSRRRKLSGKRLQKLVAGGAPRSELQLPHGFMHARDVAGDRIKVDGKGFVPEAQWSFVPTMQKLIKLHASGASYVEIGRRMALLGVERRGQKQKGVRTFSELVTDRDRLPLSEAAKSFFVNASASPTLKEDIYLQKVRLWRTGDFHTQVDNEIRGRGITVAGLTPIYRSNEDEHGYFDVRATWPWPIDPKTGTPLEAWGVADALAKSEQRLLSEIRLARPTGGAAHQRTTKRAVAPTQWIDNEVVHCVQPRQHNSGRLSCVIFANTADARQDRRGWSIERGDPQQYARATFPLTDLCGSLATVVERTVLEIVDPDACAPVLLSRELYGIADDHQAENHRLGKLQARLPTIADSEQERRSDAEGQALLVGARLRNGDSDGAEKAENRAKQLLDEADLLLAERTDLETQIAVLQSEAAAPAAEDSASASLNSAAYLVAGLRRAQAANGVGPALLAELVAEHVTDWHMTLAGDAVRWSAQLSLPLIDGGEARATMSGVVHNCRSATGGRSIITGTVLAEQVLVENRSLADIAAVSGAATSRRALVMKHLMPWLQNRGVASRGASCALIDHPVLEARQLVFAQLAEQTSATTAAWPKPLRDLIIATYVDPELQWGFAACLDDTVMIQRIVNCVVDAGRDGVLIDDLALAAGSTYKTVRALAEPRDRSGGPTRPRYLELHPNNSSRLRPITCTHCSRQSSPANRVVLLPEVAASGYGVLCACGRAPVPRSDAAFERWHRIAFPAVYTSTLYTRIARSSLRDEPQTGVADDVIPLTIARHVA